MIKKETMPSEEALQISFNRHLYHAKTVLSSSKGDKNKLDDHQFKLINNSFNKRFEKIW